MEFLEYQSDIDALLNEFSNKLKSVNLSIGRLVNRSLGSCGTRTPVGQVSIPARCCLNSPGGISPPLTNTEENWSASALLMPSGKPLDSYKPTRVEKERGVRYRSPNDLYDRRSLNLK